MIKMTNNFDSIIKKMEKLEDLSKGQDIKVSDLLNDKFISKHTKYKTLDALLKGYGIKDLNTDNYDEITESKGFNDFVNKNSKFDSWQDMMANAGQEMMAAKVNNIFK